MPVLSNFTRAPAAFSRVPWQAGQASSATSSTSGSAKVCSRPLLSSSLHRVVERLALLARQLHAGAHAVGAPAVLAVVGEQARVELGIAGAAHRAGAPGREHLRPCRCGRCAPQPGQHRAVAGRPAAPARAARPCRAPARAPELLAQQRLVGRRHVEVAHRQLDRVFLEAVDAREAGGRQEIAVHPQVRVAARPRPSRRARCRRPCG